MANIDQQYLVDFSRRLQVWMNDMGMSQSDLARQANKHFHGTRNSGGKPVTAEITRNNISSYVNAKQFPTPIRLRAVASALGTTVEALAPLPKAKAPTLATLRVTDIGGGIARLSVDRDVPWGLATKIIELLGATNGPDTGSSRGEAEHS